MSRPTKITLQSSQESWDTDVDDNFDYAGLGSDPMLLPEFATEGALPDADLWDRCCAAVNNTDTGYTVYLSDGTSWIPLAKQGVAVADLDQDISATYSESEVQAISDKVDELLASLRDAGAIDT